MRVPALFQSSVRLSCRVPESPEPPTDDNAPVDTKLYLYDAGKLVVYGKSPLAFTFEALCPDSACGNGFCSRGSCTCLRGWRGHNCSEEVTPISLADFADIWLQESVSYTGSALAVKSGSQPIAWNKVSGPSGLEVSSLGVVSWVSPVAALKSYVLRVTATNAFNTVESTIKVYVPPAYNVTVTVSEIMDQTVTNEQRAKGLVVPTRGYLRLSGYATSQRAEYSTGAVSAVPVVVWIKQRTGKGLRKITLTTTTRGSFVTFVQLAETEAGHYDVGANHPVDTSNSLVQDSYKSHNFRSVGSVSLIGRPGLRRGQGQLRNYGDTRITGIKASLDHLVFQHEEIRSVELPDVLEPLGTADFNISLFVPGPYASFSFDIALQANEVDRNVLQRISVSIKPAEPRLTARPSSLSGGVLRGARNGFVIEVRNDGETDSGNLKVVLPKFDMLSLESSDVIETLSVGNSTLVLLSVLPQPDAELGVYKGSLLLSSPKISISVPYAFTIITNATGKPAG